MANNKVVLSDGTTLMDITDTTVTANDVAEGKVFYGANGVRGLGTYTDNPETMVVTFTGTSSSNYSCDKTFSEIKGAYDAGNVIILKYHLASTNPPLRVYYISFANSSRIVFVANDKDVTEIDYITIKNDDTFELRSRRLTRCYYSEMNFASSLVVADNTVYENGYKLSANLTGSYDSTDQYFITVKIDFPNHDYFGKVTWKIVKNPASSTYPFNIELYFDRDPSNITKISRLVMVCSSQAYASANYQKGEFVYYVTQDWVKNYIASLGSSVFIAFYGLTTYQEVVDAINASKAIFIMININGHSTLVQATSYSVFSNHVQFGMYSVNGEWGVLCIYSDNSWDYDKQFTSLATVNDIPTQATDTTLGTVKLNSSESITLNSDGQLNVGGRLGQFSGTTGIYHSKDRAPRNVGDYSFLITDAKGINLNAPRTFALLTGVNISLTKSHPAGSTTYTVTNNYANRIACMALKYNGYLSQSEAYAKENQIVPVISVQINGQDYTPDSSANDSSKPITITVETSANPTNAVTQLRAFGSVTGGYCSEYIGQAVGGGAGASLIIGQRVASPSGNVNCIVSADSYNTGNGNAIFGRQHISRKNRSFLAGTGHDTTNARSESVSALGEWSDLSSPETLFAIGDGTSHTDRSNAFEVRDQGIVLKSPNGAKWKITVDNNGNLTTTAI